MQSWTEDKRFLWAPRERSGRPELGVGALRTFSNLFISRPSLRFKFPREDRHSSAARGTLNEQIHAVVTSCVISFQKRDLEMLASSN